MRNVYLLLVATTLIAGLTPIAARMATAELPALTLAFFRFGSAGGLLVLSAPRARVCGGWAPTPGSPMPLYPCWCIGFLCSWVVPHSPCGWDWLRQLPSPVRSWSTCPPG